MIRLLLGVRNIYGQSDPAEWTEVLPDGATQADVVKFIGGFVEGYKEIQKGEWEIQPIDVRLIDDKGAVLFDGVLT